MKFSLALDIANGMGFLHGQGMIHGMLSPECCCIDQRWNVKITDWEHHRLEILSRGKMIAICFCKGVAKTLILDSM